jgi:AraC-like DNA-binding protein
VTDHWLVSFSTLDPLPSFPRLMTIAGETQTDPSYRHEGRFRQGEGHCIFKYTLAGEGAFRDGDGEHRLPVGTGFLCRIADPATAYYYPADGTGPWSFVYCAITGSTALAMVTEYVGRAGAVHELPPDHAVVREMLGRRVVGRQTVDLAAAEGARFVGELFAALDESRRARATADPGAELCRAAMALVAERLDEPLTVGDLARRLGVSREHLTRCFTERVFATPYRWICRQKVLAACRLLKETDLTNAAIAARLGYDDVARFQRVFKRVMQLTPRRFRAVGSVPVR